MDAATIIDVSNFCRENYVRSASDEFFEVIVPISCEQDFYLMLILFISSVEHSVFVIVGS